MKSYPYIPSMVQAITVLTVLKMMTKAQTSCGSGSLNGKILYERLPNIQLQGFDDDVVRDTAPPFTVLEKCQDMCLRDRSSNNIVRQCASFDFQPGSRIATFNGDPQYEESTCYLTGEQARPEGLGTLMLAPNSIHFTEVCISSSRTERECPNRRYVFERHPRKKLKLPPADIKEMAATNRSECEDKCLNEFSFVCRSATFDLGLRTCTLSRFTRRTHPELLEDDPDSDYLENTCLNADRRCDGLAVFIKEENKRLGGPFEVDLFTNLTLEDCQIMCVRAEKYLCRSIEYDEMTKQCTLSEEDSVSQKDDIGVSSSPTHHFYDFVCLDSPRGSEYPDNSVTSHLFTDKKPDTAFQRYRNSRLGGDHNSEISGRSLSECLDECLRQPSFQCRSAEYSERYRSCRLSRFNQRDGMRIIYDADYDYYENLMLGGDGDGSRPDGGGVYHPGDSGGTYRPGGGSRYPPGERYPITTGSRYPPNVDDYDDRYPSRRPGGYQDRYPTDDRYGGRYPSDRYPYRPLGPPRYPPSSSGGDKFYPVDDRDRDRYPSYILPSGEGGLYPRPRPTYSGGYGDRYGSRYGDRYDYKQDSFYGDRLGGRDRYNIDRYPVGVGRYPSDRDRYSGNRDKYYPDRDRYNGGYRSRYDEDDRYNARYGDRYNDRYGGTRYGGNNNRYDVNRYDTNRYSYYGDDRDGGSRYFFRPPSPDRRPYGRPVETRPPLAPSSIGYDARPPLGPYTNRRPLSPGPDGPIYDGLGPVGPGRPYASRCDDSDSFKQMGSRLRARKEYVRKSIFTPSLGRCQQECVEERDFICKSFNFREAAPGHESDRENCELSDRDTRYLEMGNSQYFDNTGNFDYYERSISANGLDGDCLDVSQVCSEDGMEFTLRTPEGFYGRIYAHGFYDRCFFRGNGGTINVLRISGAQGYPECGTQRYGDTMTNIVVVQFSDYVQTGKDKRFNLTCLFRGPGEAVVSSGFIGAGSGSPIPIEYLPAENTLSSKVRLMILYQGRPTTTIAVGDPLTFRLEAQDGYNYATDIFATNVVARDPYSGRSVQLIDRFGCPVDPFVFPELDKGRNADSLEARFNAFKIPESNFLVFEATVRTCREGCQPAYCQTGSGRSEPSFGRRRRSLNDTQDVIETPTKNSTNSNLIMSKDTQITSKDSAMSALSSKTDEQKSQNDVVVGEEPTKVSTEKAKEDEPEYVREMIEVFDSREEMPQARKAEPAPEYVCLSPGEYHGFIGTIFVLVAILLTASLLAGLAYRKYWLVMKKNMLADRISSSSNSSSTATSYPTTRSSGLSTGVSIFGTNIQKPFSNFSVARASNFPILPKMAEYGEAAASMSTPPGGPFEDPSEPIYTDPSLFERSRSLRSIAVSAKRRLAAHQPN
ncbi:uncharacterized protein LOC115890446 [Sitophilus oryzae]|uniref:Uncharacterized protein LOC115890446 n=1 Tax=Sitophilus oryzae TaxID=7048 RepID=A0A6J2YUL8_SITOR|nr:uncharacterized protein LOC115890446 [Sitophilus oryzae]